ncbi:FAD-dependent oxidoreductase [Nocardioides sp. zg-DK7169]|uniref:FAD-dependent oxidoreductase n=1 Tax=Nocardioides sp. zg-DK7169 TaxID=2736600 RepID=UPI00155326ED|nr:FAD-dependent oxidoreductase [Nocardioides sp. zg-DK7169]NPC97482.1 FAD-binding protein [Nocardioides sp. zg-DK7169]
MTQAEQYDVVVVGSGGGALTGALLAARAGLRTVVVEKTEYIGGTSAYSGGACWLPGTDVQQRAGLPDSTDAARTYLNAVLSDPDQDKLEAFVGHAPALVAELEAMGIDFVPVPFAEYFDAPGRVPNGRSIQVSAVDRADLPAEVAPLVRPPVELDRVGQGGRSSLTGGQALIARLAAAYVEAGGEIRTNLPVTGYVTDDAGRVVGAAAMTPEGPVELRAERGVLVAAGGFERNPEMRAAHGVPGDAAWTMAPAGTNTGEPIEAAIAIGAAADFGGVGWFCPGLEQPSGAGSFTLGFRSGLMVDSTGRRYANESLPYDRFGREMAKAPERIPSWYIFDDREGGQLPAIAIPQGDADEHLAAGTWVKADTIAELAEATGLPVDALVEQVERFNSHAEQGVDPDFGRGQDEYDTFFAVGTGPNKALTPCDKAPFYAARFVLSDLGTKGGLVTDAVGRVLREDGSTLPGLYASSNSTASMFGGVYPAPGAPLGSAMVFASLAVRDLIG